jgi:hypothetical protein
MKQIVCDNLKRMIKQEIHDSCYTRCRWKTEPIGDREYCHFLANIDCGFWNPEVQIIEKPCRNEFYPCDLPQTRMKYEK